MLTQQEKSQIRGILQSPQWKTIERLADLVCTNIKNDSPLRDTQWETLRVLLSQEGQIQGIRTFIREAYNQCQD
jgi:hypothetical protein